MTRTNRHSKILTMLLLLVQLCLPLSGSLYISEIVSRDATSHTEMVCSHAAPDSDHNSQDSHKQIPHCHELDAPYDTVSGTFVKHSTRLSSLIASYKGAILPGYSAPLEIPPQSHV